LQYTIICWFCLGVAQLARGYHGNFASTFGIDRWVQP
jgi:hypothetical protein